MWHRRLGYDVPVQKVSAMLKDGQLPVIDCKSPECNECSRGKFYKRFTGTLTKLESVGCLHAGLKGQIDTPREDGHKYFFTIVEKSGRLISTSTLKTPAEESACLIQYSKWFERQTNKVIGVHKDGGPEFKRALAYFDAPGATASLTTSYSPSYNGLAERTHRVMLSLVWWCLLQGQASRFPLVIRPPLCDAL